MSKAKDTGYILWQGASRLVPSRKVVAIVTMATKNGKTGAMPQVWILDTRQAPHTAHKRRTVASRAICGDCKHGDLQSCYVAWHNAPLSVWRKFKRGGYRQAPLSVWRTLRAQGVRMGAAGDPAALDPRVLQVLKPATAYTHQWNKPEHQSLAQWAMASTDTPQEQAMARALGWRQFQVAVESDPLPSRSIPCPSAQGVQCVTCKLCSGNTRAGAKDIQIPAHGPPAKRYREWRQSLPVVR